MTGAETFYYAAEWRLMRAGDVSLSFDSNQAILRMKTTGLAGKIYNVKSAYTVVYEPGFCASSSILKAEEANERFEVLVTYNHKPGKVEFLERDLIKDKVVDTKEIDSLAPCVHDMVSALARLRTTKLEPGNATQFPMTTGKKSAKARIEAQQRETIKTPLGEFKTIRYEALVYNGILFRRKARMFLWISDDERRLPVQMRVQMPFYLGTVTLKLEK